MVTIEDWVIMLRYDVVGKDLVLTWKRIYFMRCITNQIQMRFHCSIEEYLVAPFTKRFMSPNNFNGSAEFIMQDS